MFPRAFFMRAAALAVCGGASCAGVAQMTPAKITFKNPGPYSQAALEKVAGVHAGTRLSVNEVQKAAQRLIDTGYFDDVGVDSKGTSAALNLIFLLKPLPLEKMVPVGFENFVWLQPEELKAALAKFAPLFDGRVPEAGNQMDAIGEALRSALADKGAAGATIEHQETVPNRVQPVRALQWRVASPVVVIHTAQLAEVPEGQRPAIEKIVAKLRNAPYAMGYASDSLPGLVLAPMRDAGYLDARLDAVHTSIASSTTERVSVDVSATVNAGPPYTIAALELTGSALMDEATWRASSVTKPGDVASAAKLRQTEAVAEKPYQERGYIDAYVDEGAVKDASAHTVSYHLKVVPGEVYRLGDMQVIGLSPEARAQFDLAWKMKPGDPYNAQYVKDFLGKNTAMRSLTDYSGAFQAAGDPQTHLVTLTIKMVRAAGGR